MSARTLTILALAALLATGCGFQLRGRVELSPQMRTPYLDAADRYTALYAELRAALEAAGAQLAPSREAASAVIHIHVDESGRNVLSVSARNTPQEYEVFYTIEYSVTAGGQELLPRQSRTVAREYAYDDRAVLAKQNEERRLREALARELASITARRLASL